ncbi:MAG TPA: mechanosensitive ion channel family protein [Tepidisphaeraceae bacterium]|nr:mechanosensitive ion channel family protein [Tepidisphaeraceae bacterium]
MLLRVVATLIGFVFPLAAMAAAPATAPATSQPAPAAAAAVTVAPSTQPVTVVVNADVTAAAGADAAKADSIGEVFGRTRFGQLFRGEKRVTLSDVRDPLFWIDTIKDLVLAVLGFIPRLVVAFGFIVFFWLIYRTVRKLVLGSMSKANVDPSIRDMLSYLLKWAIMGFGMVIAFNQIGVQIAALLTGVSIIGLAVGFAAQETLANFIAGIVIFWDKPFKIGDWVQMDGELAQVQRVTFRSTRLFNLDNDVVVVPNTMMIAQKFVNKTTNSVTRASVPIGIAYKESIDEARQVLLSILKGDGRIVSKPSPIVEVRACGASSVDLMLHFWINEESYEDAMQWEYLEKAKKALDAAGIEIPFPHVQLLVEETPAIQQLANGAIRRAG